MCNKLDNRSLLVKLTPNGRKLTKARIRLALGNQRVASRGFSEREIEQLYNMPGRIFDNSRIYSRDEPFILAAGNGNFEIVRGLLKAGAHAGAANGMALWVTSQNGYSGIVNLLKKAGARWPGGGSGPPAPREGTSHTSMDVAMAKLPL